MKHCAVIFIFVLTIFASGKIHAGSNEQFANKKEINVYLYNRYIKPQLKAMLRDYLTLVKSMNPFYQDVQKVHDNIDSLNLYFSELYEEMRKNGDKDKIAGLFEKLFYYTDILQDDIFDILDLENRLLARKKEDLSQRYFYVYPYFIKISEKVLRLNYLILDAYVVGQNEALFKKSTWDQIEKEIWEIDHLFEKVIYLSLDTDFENDFLMVWSDFFRIIQKQILPQNNIEVLAVNLDKMNFCWNNFNKDMSKGGKLKDNKDLLNIGIIHNRWNSILKLILN